MADEYYDELDVGGVRDRGTIVNLNAYWRDKRTTYDGSGNLLYWACHHQHNAPTSDEYWEIWKYTTGTNGIDRIEGPLPGSVDNQTTLNWGV